jgi:hypothetical protein
VGVLDERLRTIRAKLDELKRADAGFRVFGAATHRYIETPAIREADVRAWEIAHGIVLPEELRTFVQDVHAGGPGPGYGFFGLSGSPTKLVKPFSFTSADARAIIERRTQDRYALLAMPEEDDEDADWPPGYGFLELAHQGCGMFDLLVVNGEQRGTVWWTDWGYAPWYRTVTGRAHQFGFLDWYEDWLERGLDPTRPLPR